MKSLRLPSFALFSPSRCTIAFQLLLAAAAPLVSLQASNLYSIKYTIDTTAGPPPGFLSPGQSTTGSADGTGSDARFRGPYGIAVSKSIDIYVTDSFNHTIRRIGLFGHVTTLAGLAGTPGSIDGKGDIARFNFPVGIAVDAADNLYVTDAGNQTIRKITPLGFVTTLAGKAGVSGSADGLGDAARFSNPSGIAVDKTGTLYVSDAGNHTIRKITPAGLVSTFAGMAGQSGSIDGSGPAARFNFPAGLGLDESGNVYLADYGDHRIRKVTPAGLVTTLAGGGAVMSGSDDGTGDAARFNSPFGLAVDPLGTIYVADSANNLIRRVTPAGVVRTVAGAAGVSGGADGSFSTARFNRPYGVAVDKNFYIRVADTVNSTIRRGYSSDPYILAPPKNRTVSVGVQLTLTATLGGYPLPTVQWKKNGVDIPGATNPSYTIPSVVPADAGLYQLIATNVLGFTQSAWATVTVKPVVPASDFNFDGHSDILLQNMVTGDRLIWLMNGTVHNSKTDLSLGMFGTNWSMCAVADFDNDGRPDIFVMDTNSVQGDWQIWSRDQAGQMVVLNSGQLPLGWRVVAAADFNSDGHPDLLLQRIQGGSNAYYYMDGPAPALQPGPLLLNIYPLEWSAAATGDFNHDGWPDIVWENTVTGQRRIALMVGPVENSKVDLGIMAINWSIVAVADYNGDGHPDILFENTVTGQRMIKLMTGTQITGGVDLGVTPTHWSMVN